MIRRLHRKYALVLGALGAVALVVGLKLGARALGWEVLSLNPLLSGIVAADVFLMGFLLTGVLTDYKESERLPGEIAASLEVFFDEASTLYERTQDEAAFQFLTFIQALGESIHDWFYKKERTNTLMDRLSELNRFFFALDPLAQSGTIQRLKQEQQTLRRTIIRIHTIRETTFVSAGYLIAEWTTAVVALALVLSKVGPFFESMFIVGVIIFLLSYLILLIRDLENPFAYYDEHSSADVSLKPLENSIARIKTRRESASAHNEKVA